MQRKATKKNPGPNAKQKKFIAWVKSQCCIVCGSYPCIAHHCEGSTFAHNKVKCGHWFIIPLCQNCDDVITNESRRKFREFFGSQSSFWARTIEDVPADIMPPDEVIIAINNWGR